jgi:UDP-MurNAc hydroxylase
MLITGLGHAGLRIDTAAGSVLVDPWTTPASLGAWTPFPDNADLDWATLADVDLLFVSSVAPDRLDLELLARYVPDDVPVLLPEFPLPELRDRLAGIGFTRFVETRSGEVTEVGGLRIAVPTLTRPTDGPSGTAMLWLSDGTSTVFVQGDGRPRDLAGVTALGPVDVHLLQVAPAGWSPVTDGGFPTARRYVSELGAPYVVPTGGPPAVLDRPGEDSGRTAVDPVAFRDWMAGRGYGNVRLLPPGAQADPQEPGMPVRGGRPDGNADLAAQRRRRPAWTPLPAGDLDLLTELRGRLEPLLVRAPGVADGIGIAVRLTATDAARGDVDLLLDFPGRTVRPYDGAAVRYALSVDRAILEHLVAVRETDWVHSLFRSGRFSARRTGRENELLLLFLGSLDPARLDRLEAWLTRRDTGGEDVTVDGWTFQRLCPHQQADLTAVGSIEDGVLTCGVHGWAWRLSDGACLTVRGMDIRSRAAP